jgi:hypothetical protein
MMGVSGLLMVAGIVVIALFLPGDIGLWANVVWFFVVAAGFLWTWPRLAIRFVQIQVTSHAVNIDGRSFRRTEFAKFVILRRSTVRRDDGGTDVQLGEIGFVQAETRHSVATLPLKGASRFVAGINDWLNATVPVAGFTD